MTDTFETTIINEAQKIYERQARLSKIKTVNGAVLMKKTFEPPSYLWAGILPDAGAAIVAAKKALGKTFLLLQLADAISKGRDFLGVPTKQSKVLFLELEISERRIQQRLLNMGIVASENLTFAWEWPQGEEGLQRIVDYIAEFHTNLVVVDMFQHLWPQDADYASYQDSYRVLAPLRKTANDLGCMIILVTHIRKQDAADPMDTVIGSTGNVGNADVILQIIRQRGEKREGVLDIQGNDIEPQKIALRFNIDPLGFSLSDASPKEIGQTPERREILDAMRELGGTAKPGQIAQIMGKNEKAVSYLLQKLKNERLLVSVKYGEYSLPLDNRTSSETSIYTPGSTRTPRTDSVNDGLDRGTSSTSRTSRGSLDSSIQSDSIDSASESKEQTDEPPPIHLGKSEADWPACAKPAPDDDALGIF